MCIGQFLSSSFLANSVALRICLTINCYNKKCEFDEGN